ncbi:MAG: DUF2520 domain-containing protein [Dysgonamonadaceae bacterium]|jgi:predicted short-subunit dehydrogenase-like oxidoreductase (DUF2520 family)|nr:DUF2520 domain-containing protein [Dysgonamonadaceae bacterium]
MSQPAEIKIVLVGAGNVATHLGSALQEKGFSIIQVYSHTLTSAGILGNKLQTKFTHTIQDIDRDADLYLFSLKDSVLPEIIEQFFPVDGLLVHTSGTLSWNVFERRGAGRFGVLYPLQTFSKTRKVAFDTLPVFIEANNPKDEDRLETIALTLSNRVVRLSSDRRKQLHLAAVFACNFTNHLYAIAAEILEKQDLPWNVLLPLIQETAAKVKQLHPKEAQTGPAVRYDQDVMNSHLESLKGDPDKQELYRMISRSIQRFENNV